MLSRLKTWAIPAIVGAFMAASPANASLIATWNVGATGLHTGDQAVGHAAGATSGTDDIVINITDPSVLSPGAALFITLTPALYTSFNFSWTGDGSSGPVSLGPGSTTIQLPFSGLASYLLQFTWAANVGPLQSSGYLYSLDFESRGGAGDVPLPPAIVLFGSALVGLLMLKRRRSRRGAEFAAA